MYFIDHGNQYNTNNARPLGCCCLSHYNFSVQLFRSLQSMLDVFATKSMLVLSYSKKVAGELNYLNFGAGYNH